MAVLAVFIPVLMLGIVLALGRYEEWMLPSVENAGTVGTVGNAADPDEADAVRRAL
ncbi:hypothetical protein OG453_32505 [Streptomyces sp. NBC_01381]|uniref:hypothetical protein n=1 Tax=unclassified Streptomyces TaxID=2593676 RepID=UPI00225C2878|nr:hypothetical protein [Streptomyces sp. NBC_01381]MCX4671352.1 hypothetical protein [Streptomyces sp. NBC_01381]